MNGKFGLMTGPMTFSSAAKRNITIFGGKEWWGIADATFRHLQDQPKGSEMANLKKLRRHQAGEGEINASATIPVETHVEFRTANRPPTGKR